MGEKRVASMHFGGPMGLAGLALLAGAAGIVVFDGTRSAADDAAPTSVAGEAGEAPKLPTDTTPGTMPDADVDGPILGSGETPQIDPVVPKVPDQTPDTSTPDTSTIVIPKPPIVKPVTPESQPATQTRAEATFIVRIKGNQHVDEAAKLFRKDSAAAEKAFAKYQTEAPDMKGFRLVGASYSGELKLAYEFAPGVNPTRAEVRKVQEKIMAVKGVAYADPDYIAHPGKKD